MQSTKFTKLLLLLYLLILLAITGCIPESNRFGVIFTNDYVDIYRIPDNTQRKVEQLTFTPTIGEYGLFASKNGDKIVFEAGYTSLQENVSDLDVEIPRRIYLLDITSKKLVDITDVLSKYPLVDTEFFMDWSPDQKQFVVISYDGAGDEIRSFLELMDFDGTNKKHILIPITGEIPSLINGVKWSPNGEKFVLTQGIIGDELRRQYSGSAILVYDLETGHVVQIADYNDQCLPREWSPTSLQIVVTCAYTPPYGAEGVSGPETVRILDVENPGRPYERIAFTPCYDPSWSPDGKQLAFVCNKGTDLKGLFITNSDGNGIREVKLENFAVLKEPAWSPDGTQIVYVAGGDYEHTNIYSVQPDGSNNHPLTSQEAFYRIVSVYPLP